MMGETKELVEAKKQELEEVKESYGATDDINATDLMIGRIATMQALSKLVQDGDKVRPGDMVNLLTGEILANSKNKKLEFIPIKSLKYWIEKDADSDQFLRKIPGTSPNELPWEEHVNGRNITRVYHHSFYVLLPHEIKTMEDMPIELAFRSTDLLSARRISSFLFKMRRQNLSSWDRVFFIHTEKKTKNDKSWFGTSVGVERTTTMEERYAAKGWYDTLSRMGNEDILSRTHEHEGENEASGPAVETEF
jgi:hypothetical protein